MHSSPKTKSLLFASAAKFRKHSVIFVPVDELFERSEFTSVHNCVHAETSIRTHCWVHFKPAVQVLQKNACKLHHAFLYGDSQGTGMFYIIFYQLI